MAISAQQRKDLIAAQQGELDAVQMYLALAEVAKEERDREAFKRLAAEEGRHAAVFYHYTKQKLSAKNTLAKALVALYKVSGKKRLYPFIAKGEYAAVKKYEPLIADFPEVKAVKDDEKRHGDEVMRLL